MASMHAILRSKREEVSKKRSMNRRKTFRFSRRGRKGAFRHQIVNYPLKMAGAGKPRRVRNVGEREKNLHFVRA